MKMNNSGPSMYICFRDWSGSKSFGVLKKNEDSISLIEFRDFCWDAGRAYGFSENQMDSIFNWELNDDTN